MKLSPTRELVFSIITIAYGALVGFICSLPYDKAIFGIGCICGLTPIAVIWLFYKK